MTANGSRPRKIAARLSGALAGFLDGKVDEASLVRKLRKLATDIEGDMVLKAPAKNASDGRESMAIALVVDHWKKRMMKPKAKATDGRARIVCARLKEGYTVEQMCRAIDGCASSEFHMGENDGNTAHNDLTLILRNGEKLEGFAERAKDEDPGIAQPRELRVLMMEAQEAMDRGDAEEYNRLNVQIREARA